MVVIHDEALYQAMQFLMSELVSFIYCDVYCIPADGRYCITGGNDRTVRLWNPTRIDPAYKPLKAAESTTISSQNYYKRRYGQSQSNPQEELPSALPMQTYTEGHMHPVHSVDVNTSSTTLLSCSDKTLVCTDLVTAQVKQKWWGHVARIECVACLGGGDGADDIYASASYDATVRLWDSRSKSKDPLMILEDAKDAVTCVSSVSGEAQIVTSSVDGKVCASSKICKLDICVLLKNELVLPLLILYYTAKDL